MVSTCSQVNEQRPDRAMARADPMALLLLLQREMAEMKQKGEEEMRAIRKKNEDDIHSLRQQNEQDIRSLKQENKELRRRLLGERADKTKVITISRRSKVNTPNPEKEDEVSYQTGETSNLDERCHPFMDGIINIELPAKWRGLTIDRYDGSTDPDEHIDVYTTDIGLFTTSEAIMCRVFSNSLKGMTLSWFTKLPPYSIDSFKTLVNLFTTQFATSIPHHLTSIALINIRQGKGESLRAFMDRFNQVAPQIQNLNSEVALRPRPFTDSLCKKPATDMNEMRVKASKFMRLEELRDFGGQMKIEPQTPHYHSQPDKTRVREKPSFPPPPVRSREARLPRFANYTSLNTSQGRVLEEALSADLMPTPRKVATPGMPTHQNIVVSTRITGIPQKNVWH